MSPTSRPSKTIANMTSAHSVRTFLQSCLFGDRGPETMDNCSIGNVQLLISRSKGGRFTGCLRIFAGLWSWHARVFVRHLQSSKSDWRPSEDSVIVNYRGIPNRFELNHSFFLRTRLSKMLFLGRKKRLIMMKSTNSFRTGGCASGTQSRWLIGNYVGEVVNVAFYIL